MIPLTLESLDVIYESTYATTAYECFQKVVNADRFVPPNQ